MDLAIAGKVALITGGARGIGKAVALTLAQEGCKVGILDIMEDESAATVQELEALGAQAAFSVTDVADPEAVNASVNHLAETLGGADILVCSAAVLSNVAKIELMDQEMWQRDLDVNLSGVFNSVRAVLPFMQAKNWGRIVVISSAAGTLGGFGQAGYSSTKAAIIALMKTVALEQARYNITANAVVPGIVGTEMFQFMRDDMKDRIRKRGVFRREADPQEVAAPIAFLCSAQASYITGTAVDISAGLTLFTF